MSDTKCLGAAKLSGMWHMLYCSATDGTALEFTVRDISGSLKNWRDVMVGKTLQAFWAYVGTPSDLDKIQLLDENGGIVNEWQGCINNALGQVPQIVVPGLAIPIKQGYEFKITTSD